MQCNPGAVLLIGPCGSGRCFIAAREHWIGAWNPVCSADCRRDACL